MKAKVTTLGADDGIGVAMEMAILAAKDVRHGPLECVFTSDEETGLTGAEGMKDDFMTGDYLATRGAGYDEDRAALASLGLGEPRP